LLKVELYPWHSGREGNKQDNISFVINAMQFLFRMEDVDDHMYREREQLQQIVTTDLVLRFFLVLMAGHAFSCCD
ncbi:unnamed protein product, partial [Ixodes persulcatus]